ncbi:hypothetical protein GH714_027492 [Hevea brasiliensis]|uniref:RING-type E3 ubiquitin transferase n=1 Tax=Hevea brasiliensis TaxID=3981 RepID=A0A6A6N8A5_HEVBR|nr:hypothetical protein GH714_027492 [Hevea brasiliensis]
MFKPYQSKGLGAKKIGEGAYDVEDTIFVAVGKNVEKCKTTLFWAVQSFAGRYMRAPCSTAANAVSLTDRKLAVTKPQQDTFSAFHELEKKKMLDVLNQYCLILAQEGVRADKVWIEMDNIEKGIVEIIARYNIRWLVMGAAADKYYSKYECLTMLLIVQCHHDAALLLRHLNRKLEGIKSKKAMFVHQHAPISCHIWGSRAIFLDQFLSVFLQFMVYQYIIVEFPILNCCSISMFCSITNKLEVGTTMDGRKDRLLLTNSDSGIEQSEHLRLGSYEQTHRSLDADDFKGILEGFNYQCTVNSSQSSNIALSTSKMMPFLADEVEILSRVRHPHLITLIGTCLESRSLVYEYVRNGSLEDCLECKNKRFPLPWQTRICIATEICSALIFLHSNKPCIIHGNLKPSKVLLDANSVSKINDFGISYLISRGKMDTIPMYNDSKTNFTSVYTDPQYLETGTLTPESDIYSFGIILLRLLTGRPVSGLVKDVKCALEKENVRALLDCSSGDWPAGQAELLARLALNCCENNRLNRPDLVSDIWSVLEPLRVSCIDSACCRSSKELHRRIPSHFVCPIFQEVMKDPQIAADGFTYDAEAIRGWLRSGHNTSPMTNLKLAHCSLLPNHALHQAIQEWQQRW